MKLEWSVYAVADRDAVFEYIAADNPIAAIALDEKIAEAVHRLSQYPELGRLGRVAGTRELVIAGTSYIAAYCIAAGAVRILRIPHTSREWPQHLDE